MTVTHRDQRVVEAGNHGGHAVDELKAEPEIDQHAQQRIERGQRGLLLQLLSDGRTHNRHVADIEPLRETGA